MDTSTAIRVCLVDNQQLVRRGLVGFLSAEPGIVVIGEAGDGSEALERLAELDGKGRRPDVVLLDLEMEPMGGVEATRRIRAAFDDVAVLVLTAVVAEDQIHAALDAGASGYLLKSAGVDEVADAIRAAHRGEVSIDPAIAGRLLASMRAGGKRGPAPAPAEPAPALPLLPRTKFHPTRASAQHVQRPRLLKAIEDSEAQVVLLSAPAGFGKSSLLGQWLAARPADEAVAWVSLDAEDNSPGDLWFAILSGVEPWCDGPEISSLTTISVRVSARDLRAAVLIPFVNLLDARGGEITIVLDDLHVISDPDALASVDWFIGHLPRRLRLVLSTHLEPDLASLRALRASGAVLDLRTDDLALRQAETRSHLRAVGGAVEDGELYLLAERIEGWPAALSLVSLALQRGRTPAEILALDLGDEFAHDLAQAMLRSQPAEIRRFLLTTSVFERFSVRLCEDVLEDPEAARVLRRMSASHLLVVPLDARHTWFRYYPLLRDLMRAQLERDEPALKRELCRRAGAWFERHGEIRDAMVHYLLGEQWDPAANLLGTWYGNMGRMSGRVRSWLGAIPDHVKRDDARLCQVAAWVAGLTGDRVAMEMWLKHGAAANWEGTLPDGAPSFAVAELMVRATLTYDDLGRAVTYGEEALAIDAPPSRAWSSLEAFLAAALYGLGRFEDAERHARAASARARLDPSAASLFLAPAVRAMIALHRGDHELARPLIAEAVAARDAHGLTSSPQALLVLCGRARYLTETGRAAEALELCQKRLRLDKAQSQIASSTILFLPSALIELARARAGTGDQAGARSALQHARELLSGAADPGALPSWIDELEATLEREPAGGDGRRRRSATQDLGRFRFELGLTGTVGLPERAPDEYVASEPPRLAPEPAVMPELPVTKFAVPRARSEHVTRERQLDGVNPDATLLLVSAPAGYGKTTVVGQWAASVPGRATAWVTLSSEDDGAFPMWIAMLHALQVAVPGLGQRSLAALARAVPDLQGAVLGPLIAEIAGFGAPLAVVLDDFHAIEDPICHTSLSWFLDHAPDNLRVSIVTRRDPVLPLGRMRVRGNLTELRTEDLRFGVDEVRTFLNGRMRLELDDDNVAALATRTEGWPAGLALGALAMRGQRGREIPATAFRGDDPAVVEYLGPEVLAGLQPEVRRFVLRTSILARFTADLCDLVGGAERPAQEILIELERANLFLISLDGRGEWFRYHHLFGHFLAAELARHEPDVCAELHRRAAAWYARHGTAAEAVEHALAAGDREAAADYVARRAIVMQGSSDWPVVERWFADLPEEEFAHIPGFLVAKAWLNAIAGRRREYVRLAAMARAHDDGRPLPHGSSVAAALALIDAMCPFGSVERARRGARLADEIDATEENAVVIPFALGYAGYWGRDDEPEIRGPLERAVDRGLARGGKEAIVGASLAHLAYLDLLRGDLPSARRAVERAREVIASVQLTEDARSCMARSAGGWLLLAEGETDRAEAELLRALELAGQYGQVLHIADALRLLAECALQRGDRTAAGVYLEDAQALIETQCEDPGRRLPELLEGCRRRLGERVREVFATTSGVEPLSERELEVLQLLASTLSLPEIGSALFVSHNTVKTHCRSIYRKLAVAGRLEAVARARELGLS
jgi:LuxR family maltose regulon positive regulatory protein